MYLINELPVFKELECNEIQQIHKCNFMFTAERVFYNIMTISHMLDIAEVLTGKDFCLLSQKQTFL